MAVTRSFRRRSAAGIAQLRRGIRSETEKRRALDAGVILLEARNGSASL
jgi:hypothetical protein